MAKSRPKLLCHTRVNFKNNLCHSDPELAKGEGSFLWKKILRHRASQNDIFEYATILCSWRLATNFITSVW